MNTGTENMSSVVLGVFMLKRMARLSGTQDKTHKWLPRMRNRSGWRTFAVHHTEAVTNMTISTLPLCTGN